MKKKAIRREFTMEIKRSMNRFLSILFIVALGVAFFSGIRSAEPDMRMSLDEYYDESKLMDVRIISTMGLTKDDVEEISSLDTVETVEPAYTTDCLYDYDGNQQVMHVSSISKSLDQLELIEGSLPAASNECVLDDAFAQTAGIQVGDTMTFYLDDDENLTQTLSTETFTVTGLVSSPLYISWNRGTSQIGQGEVNAYVFVNEDSFVLDYYTQIDIVAAGTTKATSYIDAYDDLVEQLKDVLENQVEPERCQARYDQVYEDGESELNDARQKVSDATTELADAQSKVTAGQEQIDSGYAVLDEKEAELAAAKQALTDGQAQLDASKAEYASGQEQLTAQQASYNQQKAEAQSQLEEAYNQIVAQQDYMDETQKAAAWDAYYAQEAQVNAQFEEGAAQLSEAQTQLDEAAQAISEGEQQLADSQEQISEGEQQIALARQQLVDSQADIDEGQQEIADAQVQLADAQSQVDEGQQELDDLEVPTWYIQDRNDLPQYDQGGENADRIRAIGKVFPVMFFLVAALISLTTMTRMVEEERTEIGTLLALGYGKTTIVGKYLWYAALATIGGSILGILIGEKIIPYVIVYAYQIMYPYILNIVIPYQLSYGMLATLAALASTMLATALACYGELRVEPAALMRPVPPKNGKRIFLERITFLWKQFSFSQKSTFRNIFRYKKRFLMTVFGIGSCMGLMLVGFGIKDSIFEIGTIQFDQIQHYDGMIYYEGDTAEDTLNDFLSNQSDVSQKMNVEMQNVTAMGTKEGESLSAYLFVPQEEQQMEDFITLRTRIGHETVELKTTGVVITEKLSTYLGVDVGDTITVKLDNKEYNLLVSGITEHYLYHYIYITPEYYEQVFGEAPEMNTCIYSSKSGDSGAYKQVAEDALLLDGVVRVNYVESTREQLDQMLGSLNIVIVVLIVSAGMLAFVVLYNLNNININERRRELATFKVLGFYNKEVAVYVYRENVWLTVVGMLFGVLFGKIIHRFVIVTVEIDSCMFGRNINLSSFIYSALLTALFAFIVNFVMYFKLKKIDMIESLKNVE